MNIKIANGRLEFCPLAPTNTKPRVGGAADGILPDDLTTYRQTFTSSNQTFSGSNTYSGANTFSGNNTFSGTQTFSGAFRSTATTQSTNIGTGAVTTAGGLGVTKNANIGGLLGTYQGVVQNHTGVAINTTAAGTLAVVTSGVVAGLITSTSAAAVTVTLDSVANMITAYATAGITIATGTQLTFLIDNSQGANTVTLAVDAGTQWAVATSAITGGATLTVSTANKVAAFSLYITSATTGIVSRIM